VEGVEVGWWAELLQYSDVFEDLTDPEVEGRWLDWKTEAATVDGKLIGYGTDIGPEAIAYRADLFEKAGLPTDRTEVAELLSGDWDNYFEAGRTFVEATGIPWFDGAGGTYNGMVQQLPNPYEKADGTVVPLADNADVKAIYDHLAEYKDISAGLTQWSEDWTAAFQNDGFATMLCPPWMMGPLAGNADGVEGWDIADVFPGGGGNWGGSYLAVPSQGENLEEAKKLAAWLTAPEQQIAAFEAVGAFPSQVEALDAEEVTSLVNPFFNDAPVGEIYSEHATSIEVQPYQGPNFFVINTVVSDAITRWDVDGADPAESWEQGLSAYDELGLA
ncbi:MAG: ABC transporter substrate-binding protein, partial [Brachybacterium sp.]